MPGARSFVSILSSCELELMVVISIPRELYKLISVTNSEAENFSSLENGFGNTFTNCSFTLSCSSNPTVNTTWAQAFAGFQKLKKKGPLFL